MMIRKQAPSFNWMLGDPARGEHHNVDGVGGRHRKIVKTVEKRHYGGEGRNEMRADATSDIIASVGGS